MVSDQRHYADRIKSMLLFSKGYSFREIAVILMVYDSSIRRWKFGYDEHGIDQLLWDNYQGSSAKLLPAELGQLEVYLKKTLFNALW